MKSHYLDNSKKVFYLLLLFCVVNLLSFCTSSIKTASFGKRKYTKGHFSDPIGKVRTKFNPGSTPISISNETKGGEAIKIATDRRVGSTFDSNYTLLKMPTENKVAFTHKITPIIAAISSGALFLSKPPFLDKARSSFTETINAKQDNSNEISGSSYDEGKSARSGTRFIYALSCLHLAMTFYLLLLLANLGGSGCLGCLMLWGAILFGVVGVIYLILWLVSI